MCLDLVLALQAVLLCKQVHLCFSVTKIRLLVFLIFVSSYSFSNNFQSILTEWSFCGSLNAEAYQYHFLKVSAFLLKAF